MAWVCKVVEHEVGILILYLWFSKNVTNILPNFINNCNTQSGNMDSNDKKTVTGGEK